MNLRLSTLILLALLLVGSLGLAAWWSLKLQPLNNLSWQTLPPDIPALPNFESLPQALGGQTLERPLFWESRRALAPVATQTKDSQTPVPMELLGIVSEGTQRVALLRPLQGTPPLLVRRLHAGETFNGLTIQSIDTDRVTLESRDGLQVLTLKRGSDNPQFSQQPAKLSAPDTIETTRRKLPEDLQKRIDELKTKAASQTPLPAVRP
ncbi:MAG TPA: hypothetical protein ENO09_01290 [bacterium]|nr:hypothetical protein [bacterium]